MLKRTKILIASLFVTLFVASAPVLAYEGFSGGDSSQDGCYTCTKYAQEVFNAKGYSTYYYYGFTNEDVASKVPLVRTFFSYGHGDNTGSVGRFGVNTLRMQTTNGIIDSDQMYNLTKGYYKFVFIHGCHSGETSAWFHAFNMCEGDAGNHATLGYKGTIDTGATYQNFAKVTLYYLKGGHTVSGSVWNAYLETGVNSTKYQIYGNYDATL